MIKIFKIQELIVILRAKINFIVDTISYKTKSVNKENATKNWVLVDAADKTVGRLSSMIAYVLRGKNKTTYTPHADTGDHVIVINAEKVKFTGNKMEEKTYVSYTNYPGGQRFTSPEKLLAKAPARVIEKAVKGMLPKTILGRELYRNLYVYEGASHPHEAQKPTVLNLEKLK